jgi:tetratricopeptide (TPR) repeat protein
MSLYLASVTPFPASIQECTDELGFWFHLNGLYKEAYQAWKGALWHRNTPATVYDAEWCHSLELIGLKLHTRNRPEKAKRYLREALSYKETTLSHDDIKVYDTLFRIARALVAQHKHGGAEEYFQRALEGYTRLLPGRDGVLLQISNEFAYSLACQAPPRPVQDAEKLVRMTLKARERYLGRMHQETVESVWTLGFAVEKAGRRRDAMHLYERAYEEGRRLLGEEHVDVVDYKNDLDRLKREDDEMVQWLLL